MSQVSSKSGLKQGIIDGLPLLGGYIPVAISFGVIAIQAGFSTLEATLISVFIYAGASQFLLVAIPVHSYVVVLMSELPPRVNLDPTFGGKNARHTHFPLVCPLRQPAGVQVPTTQQEGEGRPTTSTVRKVPRGKPF